MFLMTPDFVALSIQRFLFQFHDSNNRDTFHHLRVSALDTRYRNSEDTDLSPSDHRTANNNRNIWTFFCDTQIIVYYDNEKFVNP